MDRNRSALPVWAKVAVALRKESVDRNAIGWTTRRCPNVALRKESVDRNYGTVVTFQHSPGSLSARRAWIEIGYPASSPLKLSVVALRKESVDRNCQGRVCLGCCLVALRKESVDRNKNHQIPVKGICLSLSARRAWIEIRCTALCLFRPCRRSPQGERG